MFSSSAEALERAEQLAEEGEVDQAQLLQQQAEAYNKQHEELFKRLTAPDKTMLVCDICGVFINSTDNEQRRRVSTRALTAHRQTRNAQPRRHTSLTTLPAYTSVEALAASLELGAVALC